MLGTLIIYTYKRVVCVCLLVCLSVFFLSATRHLSTLRRCLRVAERAGAVAGGPARRAGKHALARARAIYTYKRVVCVCLSVCLLFIGHTTFVHFAALPPRAGEQEPSRAAPRMPGQAHAQREHARACRTTSQRKNCADAFQKQNRTRACCRIRNCRDIQKKRKRKPTCHFPSSVYSLPSLGVCAFRIVLNRT